MCGKQRKNQNLFIQKVQCSQFNSSGPSRTSLGLFSLQCQGNQEVRWMWQFEPRTRLRLEEGKETGDFRSSLRTVKWLTAATDFTRHWWRNVDASSERRFSWIFPLWSNKKHCLPAQIFLYKLKHEGHHKHTDKTSESHRWMTKVLFCSVTERQMTSQWNLNQISAVCIGTYMSWIWEKNKNKTIYTIVTLFCSPASV